MAKLVDAPDLGSGVAIRVGSSPIRRTGKGEKDVSLLFFVVYEQKGLCEILHYVQNDSL